MEISTECISALRQSFTEKLDRQEGKMILYHINYF